MLTVAFLYLMNRFSDEDENKGDNGIFYWDCMETTTGWNVVLEGWKDIIEYYGRLGESGVVVQNVSW